ncbi:hypothetical protein [Cohnella rhizosphaerae]|uniref:Uncharacterized protein n=1 Tax=Cohnella rhizosphaerae TaxID=1457232 RepID=A0A9X4KZU3_9BACL|nr:hypothetical protein [Cohnella rhizosphaerae]MDG0813593.1 hypothetical protein [Cohnella rhizosphaerae]
MKLVYLAGILLSAAAMTWADRKDLKGSKHRRWAYGGVMAAGVLLCGIHLLAPRVPGPTDWVRPLFEPLGKWLTP